MSKFSGILLLALAVTAVKGYTSKAQPQIQPPNNFVNNCGQTLHATDSARIEYKVNQAYGPREVCPFIIRFDNAQSLRFDLTESGFGDYAKVTVATLENVSLNTRMRPVDMLNDADPLTIVGSVAVVVFSSLSSEIGTGFALNVTQVGDRPSMSPNSVDQIASSESGQWRHPTSGQYSNNELSTFLVAPANYSSPYFGNGATQLQYTEISLEGDSCYDTVDVWSFDRLFTNGWSHSRKICGGEESVDFPLLQDLALVTFRTDGTEVFSGFNVAYQHDTAKHHKLKA